MIELCRAKIGDVQEIKKLLYRTWVSTYSSMYSKKAIDTVTSDWHSIGLLKKQVQEPNRLFLIAKDNERIVGMCNTATIENGEINIQRIHVDPDYQRQGIGTAFINEIVKTHPRTTKIFLEVEKQNQKAISFYRKHGFVNIAEKKFVIHGIHMPCYIMEKLLSS